jgi:acyl carrier protein phosphodiesterase
MPGQFDNLQQVNYLAHAYLSFDIPDILAGNMISDFVKGKRKLDYPPSIRSGIDLHRAIDNFTDVHAAVREAKECFRSEYGLYSAPLTDVAFDHFLAIDPLIFPTAAGLYAFSGRVYGQLAERISVFPDRFARIFPYMRAQDWLSGYRHREGIFASFAGLARRAAYMPGPERACELFVTHYQRLRECYTTFFPELQAFALRTLQRLQDEAR